MADDAVRVFISYSHRDEPLRQQLDKHLAPLKGQKVIESWHDRQISAGTEWANQIDDNLNRADIILLLVSPDFVASEYCFKIELNQAVKRHEAGEAIVVPVILEPCDWSWLPFAKFQAFPKDAKAISTWTNSNEAFLDVATGIRKVAQELFAKRKVLAEQKQANRERYLQKVEEVLSDGMISIVERDTLDELGETLGLTSEEAKEIETRAYEPYSRVEENLNKYKKTLTRLVEKGYYPFSEEIEKDLENRQRDLGLKPEDAARISKPIFDQAELNYQTKQKQLTETEKLQVSEPQRQQEHEEYKNKLERYRQGFSKAVQAEYPLNQFVLDGLKTFQQQMGLKNEDVNQIEQPIREPAEAKYQEKLKQQSEAERQRQIELEQQRQAEKEEYKAKLKRYEQEFSKLIAIRYPMAQSTLSWLKSFQQQLGLKDESVAQIEQPIREPIEAKYYEKLKPQEQAEQHRQRELEERRKAADHPQREEQEKVEYENKLRRYEQEFTKAIQAEYPLSQSAVQRLKSFQQQLKLEDEDVDLIKQIIREPMESHVRIIRNSHSMGIEAIGNQIADWLLEEHQFSVGNKAWEDKKYVVFVNKSGFFRQISGLVYEYRIELSETDKSIAIAISEGDIRKQLAALALGSTMFTFPLLATAGLGIYSSGKFKEVIFSKIESLMQ